MLLSQEELAAAAQVDEQAKEFYGKFPDRFAGLTDPLEFRRIVQEGAAALLTALGPAPSGQTENCHDIELRDGYKNTLKIFKPNDGRPPGPLVVLCFGGGFVLGDYNQLTETARALVRLFGATVININYRLAPEYKFPYAQHDAIDSIKWIANNATGSIIGADPTKGFILGGLSAGGSLTAAVSRKVQEDKLAYPLTGQWLAVPTIMSKSVTPEKYRAYHISAEQNDTAIGLNKTVQDMIAKATQWDENSELRYAVLSKTAISGQPRTYFQVDGLDPLRDDSLIYDEMLKEAGVETRVDFYPGFPHGHWVNMRGTPAGDKGRIDEMVGFGWLLGQDVARDDVAEVLGITGTYV